ncbi:fungal-specific transcription factor domain-containing protein [Hypomontagnella submonticulosa]|nr:fungal-specific transcription factor domain-containing protein [Hypomontagnella submonticulosa]
MDKLLESPIGNYDMRCSNDSDQRSKGPGLRLSWPHPNDRRRAVVAKSQTPSATYRDRNGRISDPRIVRVAQGDLETHYQSAGPSLNGPALIHVPLAWNPSKSEFGDQDLFQYFQTIASRSLAIFPRDPSDLGSALVRIALTGDTNSAKAVQRSLLALASIHRHNVYSQAVELKISALKALTAASKDNIGTEGAIQHVAAGMLLCSFEIHQTSCTSGHWISYLDGAKEVIKTFCLDDPAHQHHDISILLDWVYYHDVLARFAQLYWYNDNVAHESRPRIYTKAFHPGRSAIETMELLAKVCDAVSARPPPTASAEVLDDYKSFLKILDWRIRNLPAAATNNNSVNTALTAELYKLAMLVYLNRATSNVLNQAPRTQQQIDEAFTILSQMDSCPRQFPVFIIGCEARTDTQRVTVLDLMDRTEKIVASRSFNYVRILMEGIWTQDDLANGDINYGDKLSSVFKRCSILPTFA